MKKVFSALFLVFLAAMCVGTIGRALTYTIHDVYVGYGGGVKGLILTALDRSAIEKSVRNDVLLHNGWIELFGASMRAAGVDVLVENDGKRLARLADDSLAFVNIVEPEFAAEQTESIASLRDAAVSAGAECMFVSIPKKICPTQSHFCARGIRDESNRTSEMRIAAFAAAGYDVLDLHARMHEEGLSHPSLYFRTDHHWMPQAGLWAAGEIARALGIDDALLAPELFEEERHPASFLGSEGKHLGSRYCAMDDFNIPYPTYETELTFQSDDDAPRTGVFLDALLYRERMEGNPYKVSAYVAMLNGDNGIQRIRNHRMPQGRRILLIKDSFTNAMAGYLALACAEVDLIDLRHTDVSALQFARDGGYDAVLVTISAQSENKAFIFI